MANASPRQAREERRYRSGMRTMVAMALPTAIIRITSIRWPGRPMVRALLQAAMIRPCIYGRLFNQQLLLGKGFMVHSSSLFCPTCGAANDSDATLCFACGQSLQAASMTDSTFLKKRYRTLNQLGQGGMGAVYIAEDTALGNRLVAIKEMSQRGMDQQESGDATRAFNREALMLANLMHPHLPRIYDHFAELGRWYLVMDFIEAETLED